MARHTLVHSGGCNLRFRPRRSRRGHLPPSRGDSRCLSGEGGERYGFQYRLRRTRRRVSAAIS